MIIVWHCTSSILHGYAVQTQAVLLCHRFVPRSSYKHCRGLHVGSYDPYYSVWINRCSVFSGVHFSALNKCCSHVHCTSWNCWALPHTHIYNICSVTCSQSLVHSVIHHTNTHTHTHTELTNITQNCNTIKKDIYLRGVWGFLFQVYQRLFQAMVTRPGNLEQPSWWREAVEDPQRGIDP